MQKWRWILTTLILFSLIVGIQPIGTVAAPPPPEEQALDESTPEQKVFDAGLVQALEDRLQQIAMAKTEVLAFVLFQPYIDHVIYSEDGVTALLWLGLRDPQTGEVIDTEPGLAIAKVDSVQKALDGSDNWDLTLQADMDWQTQFDTLPGDLVSDDLRDRFYSESTSDTKGGTVYRGYKLPWAGGVTHRITGSIGHFLTYFSCSEASCRYAYDFSSRTATTPATMFPLLASKGGTVYKWRDDVPNNSESGSNYIVLKDESTIPTTYQLYLHMAQYTIPANLKVVGAQVLQGQFIGNVDDTGYSTGHHLHFHVHTNYASYWGNSVDIRFEDVDTNDGTPRTCDEVDNFPAYGTQCHRAIPGVREVNQYTSGNYGAFPPTGDLIMPSHGDVIDDTTLLVGGWAQDDLGISKVQIIARPLDGDWVEVGPAMSGTTYMTELSLCDANLPNGPIDLAVKIIDFEGNPISTVSNPKTFINNAPCSQLPPPNCNPNENQVALFTQKDYQGTCKIFEVGDYGFAANLGIVGENNVESLLIGNNVRAILYDREADGWDTTNPIRSETFEANDPNLFDNRINLNMASSMQVQTKTNKPYAPTIAVIFNDFSRNTDSTGLASNESYVIDFNVRGATEFKAVLTGPVNKTMNWSKQVGWSVGSLPAGDYTLKIYGRNSAGESVASTKTFRVNTANLATAPTVTAPVSFDFESGSQNWDGFLMWYHTTSTKGTNRTKVWLFNDNYPGAVNPSSNLGDPNVGGGDLTSPPIVIPSTGTYYLRFDYNYQTENFFSYYDQRWVQISVNGGPFENLTQLFYDANSYDDVFAWLTSAGFNLSAYRGKTIRIRFHMDIIDPFYNEGFGWMVDNVRITSEAPITCANNSEPNDSMAQAMLYPEGGEIFSKICPQGDLDYYKFTGYAGEEVELDIDAIAFGSALDPYLLFFDNKGNMLAENDDVVYYNERDSYIQYTLPYTGDYYVLVKAWDYPRAGGDNYFYTLRVKRTGDFTPPQASFTWPISDLIPQKPFYLQVEASDIGIGTQSGVQKVDFYWRNANIQSPWVLLGSDTNGSDGWSAFFDVANYEPVLNGWLYARAIDGAGNQYGVLRIVKGYDLSVPSTTLSPITSPRATTYIPLRWTTNVPSSSINYYDLQYQVNGSDWQDLQLKIPGSQTTYNFLGEMGKSYSFRVRAVDLSGNVEPYQDGSKSIVVINTCSLDSNESNNSVSSATILPITTSQNHNFCGTGDVDWVKMAVEGGNPYMVFVSSLGGGASMNVEVYKNNGTTLVQTYPATVFGQSQVVTFEAETNDTYYLKITPIDPKLAGNDAKYTVWYNKGTPSFVYMPVINR
jgi:murein DD-endopeptidase MepM/ murein hydrolase activator NlpD